MSWCCPGYCLKCVHTKKRGESSGCAPPRFPAQFTALCVRPEQLNCFSKTRYEDVPDAKLRNVSPNRSDVRHAGDRAATITGSWEMRPRAWVTHKGYKCSSDGHGLDQLDEEGPDFNDTAHTSIKACQASCLRIHSCDAVLFFRNRSNQQCHYRSSIDLSKCSTDPSYTVYVAVGLKRPPRPPSPPWLLLQEPKLSVSEMLASRRFYPQNGRYSVDDLIQSLRALVHPKSRIAVVGSSGHLLQHAYGESTDSHDVIIRINGAITKGYESYVGSSTQLRLGWSKGFSVAEENTAIGDGEVLAQLWPNRGHQATWDTKRGRELQSKHKLVAIDRGWIDQLHREQLNSDGDFPSTGFVGIAMAIALRNMVDAAPPSVYGFGSCQICPKYYECRPVVSSFEDLAAEAEGLNAHHPFFTENKVREAWNRMGIIRLVEHSCNASEVGNILKLQASQQRPNKKKCNTGRPAVAHNVSYSYLTSHVVGL